MDVSTFTSQWLWPAAVGALPVAVVVAAVCRLGWCRPSTRHALWLVVLACFLVTPIIPRLPISWSEAAPAAPTEEALLVSGPSRSDARPVAEPVALPEPAPTPASNAAEESSALRALQQKRHEWKNRGPAPAGDLPIGPSLAVAPPSVAYTMPGVARPARGAAPALAAPPPALAVGASPRSWLPAREVSAWHAWLPKLVAFRDAVITLPPVPAALWVGGALVIVGTIGIRVARFRRVLRRGSLAPAPVRRMVEQAARDIGLARVPAVHMTEERVSPLVWCGRRCRLVLPSGLWEELDDAGRRAVILHELAHLRRRDHWVRWAELAASIVYWWHPVVWWVRSRLRDEADVCCDAWVTALLPRERRAYALALVSTQSYLSQGGAAPPAIGLGVMTSSAERFARRLTMVMKSRSNPRLSALGIAASLGLGVLASSTSASLWSCPPEDGKETKVRATTVSQPAKAAKAERAAAEAMKAARAADVAAGAEARAAARARAPRAGAITGTAPGQPGARGGGGQPDTDRRLRDLESRLERLDAQLERLEELLTRGQRREPLSAVPPAPPAPPRGDPVRAPRAIATPRPGMHGVVTPTPPALASPRSSGRGSVNMAPPARARLTTPGPERVQQPEEPGATTVRVYRLPDGKREAVWQLMSRDDIPVFVSQDDDGIAVHGTPDQHRAFEAFIRIINPDQDVNAEAQERYRIEVQNLERLRSGAAREHDARALAEHHAAQGQRHAVTEEHVRRHLEQAAQRHQEVRSRLESMRSLDEGQRKQLIERLRRGEMELKELGKKRSEADGRALIEHYTKTHREALAVHLAALEAARARGGALRADVESLRTKAAELEARAEAMADKADALADRAREATGDERQSLMEQVRKLRDESRKLATESRTIERRADQLSDEAEEAAELAEEAEAEECEECEDCEEMGSEPLAVAPALDIPVVVAPAESPAPPAPADVPGSPAPGSLR